MVTSFVVNHSEGCLALWHTLLPHFVCTVAKLLSALLFNYAFIVRAGHKSTTCQHHASISQSQIHKPSCANRASNPASNGSGCFCSCFLCCLLSCFLSCLFSATFSPVSPFCIQLKHADRTQSAERTYVTRYGKCFS